ncbi:MAG: hypothetical protein ABIR73_12195 [Usitatibacter sp.]
MTNRTVTALLAVVLMTGAAWTLSAAEPQAAAPSMGMHHGAGMGGMMSMMDSCDRMMHGDNDRMMQGGSMGQTTPQLPPGNDKLQLQMQAEIMQKTGEIVSRYAARIADGKN